MFSSRCPTFLTFALFFAPVLPAQQLGDAYIPAGNLSVSPSTALAGTAVTVFCDPCNRGPGNFYANLPCCFWTDRIYISSTASKSNAATLATIRPQTGSLTPGGCYSDIRLGTRHSVTIPASLAEGLYYIGYSVDDDRAVPETNDANNDRWVPILVKRLPDYRLADLACDPTTAAPGRTVTVDVTLFNSGGTWNASATDVGIYLVPQGANRSATDLVAERRGIAIGARAGVALTFTFPAPARMFGHYQLVVVADHLGLVIEGNEGNNTASLPFRLGPNAAVTFFGTPCGPLRMGATGTPRLGDTFSLDVSGVTEVVPVFLMLGLDRRQWAGIPLPLDLSFAGMSGCHLYVAQAMTDVMVPGVGATYVSFPVPIPLDVGRLGGHIYAQGFSPLPNLNSLGIAASDAADVLIGW